MLAWLAGTAAAVSAIGLLATSAWLISRASQQPPIRYLMVAVTAVRAFAIARSAFRYAERLAGHLAARQAEALIAPAAGAVALGGADITGLDGDEVRTVVGLCAQDAHIFDSTLAENLRLARPTVSEDELRGALRRARVLLADFPIVILDEPAEHLDEQTAGPLTLDLLAATLGRTTLLITHRPFAPGDVDQVLRLRDGRLSPAP